MHNPMDEIRQAKERHRAESVFMAGLICTFSTVRLHVPKLYALDSHAAY